MPRRFLKNQLRDHQHSTFVKSLKWLKSEKWSEGHLKTCSIKEGFWKEARLPQQKDTKGGNYFQKRFAALKHFLFLINRREVFAHTSCQVKGALGHLSDSLICVPWSLMGQRDWFSTQCWRNVKGSDWITCLAVEFTEVTIVRSSHYPAVGSPEVYISYGSSVGPASGSQHESLLQRPYKMLVADNETGQLEEP